MPQKADAGQAIEIDIDVDAKYIAEVLGITEQAAQFDNSKPGDMSMTWKFRLYDMENGVAVMDLGRNEVYELWNFTSDKTYFNAKTGKKAKAREWTEALVGRDLTDDEMNELIDLGFEDSLVGKRGVVDLEWYTTRGGTERLRIIRMRPYKKQAAPVAAGAPDARAQRRAALGLDNEAA